MATIAYSTASIKDWLAWARSGTACAAQQQAQYAPSRDTSRAQSRDARIAVSQTGGAILKDIPKTEA